MGFEERWHTLHELGEGGQGKVYLVLDLDKIRTEDMHPKDVFGAISEMIGGFTVAMQASHKNRYEVFKKAISTVNQMDDPANHGALKVLHKPDDARDPERAEARIKKEIEAMSSILHPNLLSIIDKDQEGRWYVSQFHPKGTLADNKDQFTGNPEQALRAFRPIVAGLAKLHENGYVHRDIKPENIFVDSKGSLILGDFGLIFSSYEKQTRLSGIWDNVGSRDWMPAWAYSIRIEDIKPTFDVFSLGKLLWAMISNIPVLRLWYFNESPFNLEEMFPNTPHIRVINSLLSKCLVEREHDCLKDANALLREVDKTLSQVDLHAEPLDPNIERRCKVCGVGTYGMQTKGMQPTEAEDFGLSPRGHRSFRIFTCNECGHIQMFSFLRGRRPPAWTG